MITLRALLKELASVQTVTVSPLERGELAELRFKGAAITLAAKIESAPDPRGAAERLRRWGQKEAPGALPALASAYIPPAIKRSLEEQGLGWVEPGGIHLETPQHLIHVDSGKAAPPKARLLATSPAVQKAVRALLERPEETWTLGALTDMTKSHKSSASRALENLVSQGLLSKVPGGWIVESPAMLLDRWLEWRHRSRNRVVERHFFARTRLRETAAQILAAAGEHELALTGRFAAEMIEPVVAAARLDVYVQPFHDISQWAESTLRFISLPGPDEATVILRHSPDGGAFIGMTQVDGVPLVGRAQLIADLTDEGGRSEQAVDALRKTWNL